jgi:hypothetical protein
MAEPYPITTARNSTTVINKFNSEVCICLETDTGAKVKSERVLLLYSNKNGEHIQQKFTDNSGQVKFINLLIKPIQPVYVILPDVLEAWSATPILEIVENENKMLANALEAVQKTPENTIDLAYSNIRAYRNFDKDAIDKIEKNSVMSVENKHVEGDSLVKLNTQYKQRKTYRHLDHTKYWTTTTINNTDNFKTIRIDRLNEVEKLQHYIHAFENNHGQYTGKGAASNKYYESIKCWKLFNGATCNGFINVFLGYWYNFNDAFTVQCKNLDFIRMMQGDGNRDEKVVIVKKKNEDDKLVIVRRSNGSPKTNRYLWRGFSELVEDALDNLNAAPGVAAKTNKTLQWLSVLKATPATNKPHIRLVDPSKSNPTDPNLGSGYRFIYNDGSAPLTNASSADSTAFHDKLHNFNIYSKSSDKKNNGNVVIDHHGGLMYKTNDNTLNTFAADGSKRDGVYSLQDIKHKTPEKLMNSKQLYLRIWPMISLRKGGFSPASSTENEYQLETDIGKQKNLNQAFRQSLPRFILWDR